MIQDDAAIPILVVDDDPNQCRAVASMLTSTSRRVLQARSGDEALMLLLREPVVVMLVDVEMPGIGGFELARLVRARPSLHHLPILFVTSGYGDADAVRRAYEAGAVDFLQKPLDPVIVRAKVDAFVELHRKEQELRRQDERLRDAERQEAELRLAELRISAARRFREFAEAMPQILFSTRPDGVVDYFNERWFAYTGLSMGAAGARWEAALDPADAERCAEAWRRSLETGDPFEGECRLVGKAGTSRWHLVRAVALRGKRAEIESWLCTCTDIDEAKRTRVELTEFRGTLDAALECVCLVDETTLRLVYANQGASDLLRYPHEGLLGLPFAELTADHGEPELRELMAPLAERRLPALTVETRFRRRDGELVPVELLLQVIRINGGRVAVIARDITARKAAEAERARLYEQAQVAIRVRDEFLAIASHELKTPLTTLNLQVQLMTRSSSQGGPTPEKLASWLEVMRRQLDRLGRLVHGLFDVARMSEGRLELRLEDVDLARIVRAAVEEARHEATEAGCELAVDVPDTLPGHWDALRLEQVVNNLLTNAIKYGGGAPIEVSAAVQGDTVRLVVRDHGIGIPADKLERIFDRYERAVSAQRYGGLGLGLYIARAIVTAHGGAIHVESTTGEGSTFTVELPVRAEAHVALPADAATADAAAERPEPEPV